MESGRVTTVQVDGILGYNNRHRVRTFRVEELRELAGRGVGAEESKGPVSVPNTKNCSFDYQTSSGEKIPGGLGGGPRGEEGLLT